MQKKKTNLKKCHVIWQRLLLLVVVAVSSTVAMAQSKVQGKVVDATGEPIIGASVKVKGTATGTVTDLDGNFTLNNVKWFRATCNGTLTANTDISYGTRTLA